MHISYGQRTEERERQSFLAICQRLKIHDKLMVRNEALRAIGGSALTDNGDRRARRLRSSGTAFRSPTSLSAMRIFSPSP